MDARSLTKPARSGLSDGNGLINGQPLFVMGGCTGALGFSEQPDDVLEAIVVDVLSPLVLVY